MKQYWKTGLWLALILIAGVAIYRSGIHEHCTFTWIKENNQMLKQAVEHNYIRWVLLYAVCLVVIVALSLPIVIPVVIAGGYLFGIILGTLYSVVAATCGAVLWFLFVRHVLAASIKQRYSARLEKFNRSMEQYGPNYLLVLHYLAVVPFFIINTFAALTNMSLRTFVRVTVTGSLPLFIIYAFAGRELGTLCSIGDMFSLPVILAFALLLALALMPIIITRLKGPVKL